MASHATANLAHLKRWKAEATQLLNDWEQVWEAAGQPGPYGSSKAKETLAVVKDLALALRLLDAMTPHDGSPPLAKWEDVHVARDLLVRHGIRQAEGEPTACPDSSLLAWGLHEVDPDGRWEA